jgi:hypothetical protein
METPAAPKIEKTPAEEPFVLCAMVSLLGSALWIALRPRLLAQFFYSAETLALTHLVTLGFASSITLGVMLRLVPEALKVAPRSRRFALVEALLWIVGVSGVVFHFWSERWVGLAWATLLVLLVALLRLWNFSTLFAVARGGDWSARWILAGLCWFVVAASLGASYGLLHVWGIGGGVLGAPLLDRLAAHLHVGLLGWFGSVIFGVQRKVLPGTRTGPRGEALRFVLHHVGLLGVASSLLWRATPVAPFALALALSLALRSLPALAALPTNRAGLWETLAHAVLLVLAVAGVALAFGLPADDELRLRVAFAYGFVALFGWITLTVAGTSWKLFSAWVWLERFYPEKHRGGGLNPVPAASDLVSPRLRDASGLLLLAGVGGVATGIVLAEVRVIAPAAWLLFGGVVLFFVQFVRIARWELLPLKWKPPHAR